MRNRKKKMGLGLPQAGDGGDFVLYAKYNAKSGRWFSKQDDGEEREVDKPTCIIDLANIKTGVMKFMAGQAPDYIYDSSAGACDAVKPDDTYKRGFTALLFGKSLGGLRELSSTALSMNGEINKLYEAYEEGKAANPGMVPVMKCTGVTPVESKHGTNYAPNLELVKWTARPDELQGNGAPVAVSTVAAPAAPAPAPVAVVEDDSEEF
jgi:hypothetical protein